MAFAVQKKQDADGTSITPEDELTCSVCLEQVAVGDLLRSLPCLHQVIIMREFFI
jgi:E3 ubiquitin-protein ligase SDIR1